MKSIIVKRSRLVACTLVSACSFQPGVFPDGGITAVDVAPPRCIDAWCRRKPITIPGSEITGSPDSVMVVVRLAADPDLAMHAEPSGRDLRFVAADGVTPIPYERERYDGATGALVAWVQVGELQAGVDATFYLYYGNPGASDQDAGAAAWPNRYAGVWHLDEPAGTDMLFDATANDNDGAQNNGVEFGAPAVIDSGFRFDGVNDYVRVPQSPSLSSTTGNATFALWINWDSITSSSFQRVMCSENRFATMEDGYEWSSQAGGNFYLYPWGGAESYVLGPSPFTAQTWHYLVATLDFSVPEVRMFVDGMPMMITDDFDSAWTTLGSPGNWLWGSNVGLTGPFGGVMDEIQVMRGTRNLPWIHFAYLNQRPDSTLLAIGPEERLVP